MNPLLLKVLGIAAAIAIVAGGSWYEGHHQEALAFDNYKLQQAAVAQKQVTTNHDAVAAVSASEVAGLKKIATDAQESNDALKKTNDALLASNGDLTLKLWQRVHLPSQPAVGVPKAAGSGPVDHGADDSALPVGLAELVKFNTNQFYAADQLAVRLTAAQAVIVQDRQICNGELPGLTQPVAQ